MRTSTLLCMAGWMLLARAVAAQDLNYGNSGTLSSLVPTAVSTVPTMH